MKKLFFLLTTLFFAGTLYANNIPFNGNYFKAKLLTSTNSNGVAKDQNGNSIKIDDNSDGQIDETEAEAVYQLNITGTSSITNIEGILFFTNLRKLDAQACGGLTSVNLSGMVNLEDVIFKNCNNLANIVVTGCVNITTLDCEQTTISTIDVSTLIQLTNLNLSNNTNLRTAFVKNGRNETIVFSGNSGDAMTYICADDSQITPSFINQVVSTCVINSYCTLPPGGNYNTITGQAVFDATGNGIDASDSRLPNIKINCSIGGHILQTTTNSNGIYSFLTQETGYYEVSTNVDHPTWFLGGAIQNGNLPLNINNNVQTHDFIIRTAVSRYDVEVVLVPINQAIPGTTVVYEVIYRNLGNQTQSSAQIKLTYNNLLLNFVSSSEMLLDDGVNAKRFTHTGLLPFQTKRFTVSFNLLASAVVSDLFEFTVEIGSDGEEPSTLGNNTSQLEQTIVSNSSVNRIECLEKNLLSTSEIGNYLHYMINFENTGTTTIDNVVIRNVFNPTEFDLNSIQIMDSSSPVDLVINNNEVMYHLRSANLGGPGGRGGVLLKIKSNATLTAGSTVNNVAEIFFDYVAGVPTNTAITTYQNLSNNVNQLDNSIKVYPNPVNDVINAEGTTTIKTIELYDVFGRLLQTNLLNTNKTAIDMSQRSTGTYFLKITTEEGQKVEQIVKK